MYWTLNCFRRVWNFAQTKSDACIYVLTTGEPFIIAIYVDDIVLAGKTGRRLTEVKREIESKFKVKDLGELHYFLGVKVVQNKEKQSIWLGQPSYQTPSSVQY